MKKFDELMSVRSEIENITAEEAKQKLNDSNAVSYTHLTLPTTPYV